MTSLLNDDGWDPIDPDSWRARISPSQIHVWRLDLSLPAEEVGALEQNLDPQELERARRFVFPEDRLRFTAAHGLARLVLGAYLGVPPRAIRFGFGAHGKPRLLQENGERALHFNTTRRGEIALLAVAQEQEMGVDIEQVRSGVDYLGIAEHFFAPGERDLLAALPEEERQLAFYTCWTRKEAYLKARGDGLTGALDVFEVSISARESPALRQTSLGRAQIDRWRVYPLDPDPGYVGALVAEGDSACVRKYRLNPLIPLQ